jgi:hypothetical protein
MTPGYYSETITLGDDADASTSAIPFPIKSDYTILATFSADLATDTYIMVEHSVDGSTWVKQGEFEEDGSVDHDDITKNRAKMAAVDDSLTAENNGIFWLYDLDDNCKGMKTRFTVAANGQDESSKTCEFQLIPHF